MGLINEAFICIGPALKMKDVRVAVNSTAVWVAIGMSTMGLMPMIRYAAPSTTMEEYQPTVPYST